MHIIEVTDPLEARRARTAQYSGLHKTLSLGGHTINGWVKSVSADPTTPKWIVTEIPTPIREPIARLKKSNFARWR